MSTREISQLVRAARITEGAGVTVYRSIGTSARPHLDPFLLLDHFGSERPGDYIAGFPDHPHRGFVTFTYMLDGHVLHHDSMGNRGDLRSGGAQWMKAASGVIHSEMPQQTRGLMRGFQLWVNLPAREKMSDPAYQEIAPEAVPLVEGDGLRVRVLSGAYEGVRGPVDDPNTGLQYLDIALGPGKAFRQDLAEGLTVFVYLFEGDARLGGGKLPSQHLAVLGRGDGVDLVAGEQGARLILVAGRPIDEPIVQYGPFVMNNRDEVAQAFADYRDGVLVRQRGTVDSRR